MTKFTNKIIRNTIIEGDEVRQYAALKLSSKEVATEGFKLLRAATPSFGVATSAIIDNPDLLTSPESMAGMLQLLAENLTEEHFMSLSEKLLGSLMLDEKPIEDVWEHFDKYPNDYLEVLGWLGKENLANFIMGNITRLSFWNKMKDRISPLLDSMKKQSLNANEQDSNEE